MSSTTVSKRLCAAIPRQSRALSLYSLQHVDSGPPPPPPYARPPPIAPARHHPNTSSSTQNSSQSQPSNQPLTPSPPLQIALSPLPRSSQSPNSPAQAFLFPPLPFPTFFPYLHPATALNPVPERSRLTYHLQAGAYGIPKRRAHTCATPALDRELTLAVQVGEDAYFLRSDAMGVADGVGGWSRPQRGPSLSNSALFSRSLMHFCSYELSLLAPSPPPPLPDSQQPSAPRTLPDVNPVDVLQRSYDRCLSTFQKEGFTGGSATALLAVLRDRELRIAHLGDCAVCLVRDGGIVYRSEEMQHAFNYPLQLGPSSPTLPAHARSISIPVQQNDIVILSSDGMTDNLWDEDVLDEVAKFTSSPSPLWRQMLPNMLSQALCSRAEAEAHRGGEDEVPFARRAREEGIKFEGGKCDDISVLVAVISPHVELPMHPPT